MSGRQNRKKRLVYGVGIDDSDYVVSTRVNGKSIILCKYWDRWRQMLRRCYSKAFHKVKPSYIGVNVCDEWLVFSNFKKWMKSQAWEGKDLDKDIVGDGWLYSPESCCFVDGKVNILIKKTYKRKSDLPTGVECPHGRVFYGVYRLNGETIRSKAMDNPIDAHKFYALGTSASLVSVALTQEPRVCKALLGKALSMRQQITA